LHTSISLLNALVSGAFRNFPLLPVVSFSGPLIICGFFFASGFFDKLIDFDIGFAKFGFLFWPHTEKWGIATAEEFAARQNVLQHPVVTIIETEICAWQKCVCF
jgi:hypothetical protein